MAASGTFLVSRLIALKKYICGPRLYKIFSSPGHGGREYDPHNLEWFGDTFIKSVYLAFSLSVYTSPIILYYVCRKGMMTAGQLLYLVKLCSAIATSLGIAYFLRGISRTNNRDYQSFMSVLMSAKQTGNTAELQKFDFEFFAWPVNFKWSDSVISGDNSKADYDITEGQRYKSIYTRLRLLPCEFVEYLIAHSVGRPMAYPGSVKLLQYAMSSALQSGRSMLIEKQGQRAKLLTRDGNEIDSMFIDRRGKDDNGNTLVICSEGNAGFYEVGCMGSPMKGGYSVLGWNHPGFAGSTGTPNPKAVHNAIDVVVRYAVTELKFPVKEIIFFAWSIGGFPASYAAMMYPDAKALILDATFDDVIELGKARMPPSLSGLVGRVIKKYFNLNNTHQVANYPGPIRLIRRFREEIITTVPGNPRTNRGNYLLIQLLKYRYPKIMTNESIQFVFEYLSAMDSHSQEYIKSSIEFSSELCADIIRGYFDGKRPTFPSDIGGDFDQDLKTKLAIYLTTMYMVDFDATHCIPLPSSYFRLPWDHEL